MYIYIHTICNISIYLPNILNGLTQIDYSMPK